MLTDDCTHNLLYPRHLSRRAPQCTVHPRSAQYERVRKKANSWAPRWKYDVSPSCRPRRWRNCALSVWPEGSSSCPMTSTPRCRRKFCRHLKAN